MVGHPNIEDPTETSIPEAAVDATVDVESLKSHAIRVAERNDDPSIRLSCDGCELRRRGDNAKRRIDDTIGLQPEDESIRIDGGVTPGITTGGVTDRPDDDDTTVVL